MKYFLLIVPIIIILSGLIPIIKILYKRNNSNYGETTGKVIGSQEVGGGKMKSVYPVIEYYVDNRRYEFLSKYHYALRDFNNKEYIVFYKKTDPTKISINIFKDNIIILGIFFLILVIYYI